VIIRLFQVNVVYLRAVCLQPLGWVEL